MVRFTERMVDSKGGENMYSDTKRSLAASVTVLLILVFMVPMLAFSQGRGRGQNKDWKWDKFVNGHDARDGRVNGRGPRRFRQENNNGMWTSRNTYRSRRYRTGSYSAPYNYSRSNSTRSYYYGRNIMNSPYETPRRYRIRRY